jgi:NTP pyrophosphatase (non-canonical NTP hydrolase)
MSDNKQYVKDATVTESKDFAAIGERLAQPENIRILHAAIGLATEAGEVQDALKKHLFYGKPLDKVNLAEEMGDIFWYMAILADSLDVSFDEIQNKNIAKLKARYGAKFTEAAALNRDLDAERKILEE